MSRRRPGRWLVKRLPLVAGVGAAWAIARFLHVHAQTQDWGEGSDPPRPGSRRSGPAESDTRR